MNLARGEWLDAPDSWWLRLLLGIWLAGIILAGIYVVLTEAQLAAVKKIRKVSADEDWRTVSRTFGPFLIAAMWPFTPLLLLGWGGWHLLVWLFGRRYDDRKAAAPLP